MGRPAVVASRSIMTGLRASSGRSPGSAAVAAILVKPARLLLHAPAKRTGKMLWRVPAAGKLTVVSVVIITFSGKLHSNITIVFTSPDSGSRMKTNLDVSVHQAADVLHQDVCVLWKSVGAALHEYKGTTLSPQVRVLCPCLFSRDQKLSYEKNTGLKVLEIYATPRSTNQTISMAFSY